ncbi:hypothetical protein H0H92_003212 [Tricholoma furcatifolium]|nr:hypothetical protein H0H92_003212 [Tricholoma furcatifolium]
MATGQVALARRAAPGPVQRPSRQAVPAFLQKLHEMVNDPKNADLIRWSDAGDSFFVLDHERFAREVLGRWFKHQNFASFVRQLNMYGFHKIPHLQQGVLKSDSDTEHWNFAHANFLRGQPDLLCLIQRKKQPTHGEDAIMDLREPVAAAPVAPLQASGQVLDVHSLLNAVTAIKRHQATISSELNELKQSNQMLWQDAMEARQRHQKQQDTINRIVKFLAGVFGNRSSPHKDDIMSNSRAVVPRRQSRFLIEDGRSGKATVEDEADVSRRTNFDASKDQLDLSYPIIESPSPSENESLFGTFEPVSEPQSSAPSPTVPTQNPTTFSTPDVIERSVTPTRPPGGLDIQAVLNHLTPAQIQQLISSIPSLDPIPSTNDNSGLPSSQIMPYTPTSDLFAQFINPISAPQSTAATAAPPNGLFSFEDNNELDVPDTNLGNISNQWKATEDIERDVNVIDTFIRGLGLDPQNLDPVSESVNSSPTTSTVPTGTNASQANLHPDPPSPPSAMNLESTSSLPASSSLFDFDSFLHSYDAATGTDNMSFAADETMDDLQQASSHSLLASQSPLPPHQQGAPIPGIRVNPAPPKRKSDASDLRLPPLEPDVTMADAESLAKSTKRRRNK